MDWKFVGELNLVAIYAAIVSTLVLFWQIFTDVRAGARVQVSVTPNMKTFGGGLGESSETYCVLNATNVGTADTTITHVIMLAYDNWWQRLRGRPSKSFIVNHQSAAQPIPFVLEVGRTFMSLGIQNAEVEALSRDKLLFMGLYHSFAKRSVMGRVRPIKPDSPKT